jgi:hypothetical protein
MKQNRILLPLLEVFKPGQKMSERQIAGQVKGWLKGGTELSIALINLEGEKYIERVEGRATKGSFYSFMITPKGLLCVDMQASTRRSGEDVLVVNPVA